MGHRAWRSPQWLPPDQPDSGWQQPRRLKPVVWVGILVGMVVWSLVAWLIYLAVDPVLAWLSNGAGAMLESGRNAAAAIGGKPAGDAVSAVSNSGLIGQFGGLLNAIAKPTIVILWVLGILVMIATPMVLTWMVRARR